MKKLIILIILFAQFNINAQNCDCQDELNFVINYFEDNLPGFEDNVTIKNQESYTKFKKELRKQSNTECDNKNDCFKILLSYVEFFKDNHSYIKTKISNRIDESNQIEIQNFINSETFKNREIISDLKFKNSNTLNSIENTYQSNGGVYTVAVIKNKTKFRDFAGVIIDSKTTLWKKGQVKFELKQVDVGTFDMFTYSKNYSINFQKNVKLKDGVLNDSWFNKNLKEKVSYNTKTPNELTFKKVSEKVNYMYIPTFNGYWFSKINEFYNKNDSLIKSKPYLIIDVRNNGGGSDECVNPLLKYIYTKPFYNDDVAAFATEENIRKYEELFDAMSKDTLNFNKAFMNKFASQIKDMKSAPNKTFVKQTKGDLVKLNETLENPRKVAILFNKNCISSCETLLFWALESDKTIMVGENSGGWVGYGDVTSVNTPNFDFELGCTITRYNKERAYEVIGVSPKYYLNNEGDWINQTLKILETH